MTATPQPESKSPTRRALLAGALGGLGALAASAIGRPGTARAHDPDDVLLGGDNAADTPTVFNTITNTGGDALHGISDFAIGVRGQSISSNNGTGVLGVSGLFVPTAKPKTGVYGYANQDNTASGVYGLSLLGVGVRGHSASGYAGYFEGRVYTNAFYELGEIANPALPIANRARLFVRDNGAGKTQLCVRFHTGGVQIIKTEL